jgi:anti-sigma B factor antagonist
MSMPIDSPLLLQRMGDVIIIEFTDKAILDQSKIDRLHQEMQSVIEKSGLPKIILSFENVQNISSAMLGVLMSLNKQIKSMGGEMRLAAISNSIMEVFKLTRLDKLLKIYRSTDQAMVKFLLACMTECLNLTTQQGR